MGELGNVSNSIQKISDISLSLFNTQKKFNETVKDYKWQTMEEVYAVFSEMMLSWDKTLKKNSESLKKNLYWILKFSPTESESFNEVQSF